MKSVICGVIALLMCGSVFAQNKGNGKGNANGHNKTVTVTVENHPVTTTSTSNAVNASSNTNTNNNSSSANNQNSNTVNAGSATANGGVATANGGASNSSSNQTQTASNAGNNQSINYRNIRQAPMAYAPDAYPSAPCRVSGSVGASAPVGGFSLGGSKLDDECDKRETARAFALMGNRAAAVKILCSTKAAKEAKLTEGECSAWQLPPAENRVDVQTTVKE